ncbi:hypothetical protein [Sedimentibacter sp.]|uniref:hypothetical protein n=1 Tax=Sedimentibacter sp. TaxID=1960295 RepID=UPI0028983D4B|nr:hypothetical protein [Sedimentibacter sp.]
MGEFHDSLASDISNHILGKIRKSDTEWKQIFSPSIHRVGSWDWPRPDIIFEDIGLDITYANEFKPPFQNKREYLTGLGQALSYLQNFNYAGLIVPKYSDDNFKIGSFINDTLSSEDFKNLPISLVEYDFNTLNEGFEKSVKILKPIDSARSTAPLIKRTIPKTFWAFWRDASPFEIFDLLNLSDHYSKHTGDIYSDYVFPAFYEDMITGKTKQWNGTPRKKTASEESRKAEKQNYKIPLFQLGLIDQSEGRLTKLGYQLLFIGKLYGCESSEFYDYLTYILLTEGKHLELINEVYRFQLAYKVAPNSDVFLNQLEGFLSDNGHIGPRKPTARTTSAKPSYIRDEPKLWNALNLLIRKNHSQYFFSSEGYKFNWSNISRILLKNYRFI